MAKIIIGLKSYTVVGVEEDVKYGISEKCFKGVRKQVVDEAVCYDFATIISVGHELLKTKEIPTIFHEKTIKNDIINGESQSDPSVQKGYLKLTRKYWEGRYSLTEMLWFSNFLLFICEIDGQVTDNWWRLYEIIRGELPSDFPPALRFPMMMENVLQRYSEKLITRTIKEYLTTNEEGLKKIQKLEIPDDLVLINEIGVTPSTYFNFVRKYGIPSEWSNKRKVEILSDD